MITVRRFQQSGIADCGPAAVCTAVSIYLHESSKFTISAVIAAAGIDDIVKNMGSTVAELAKAVEALSGNRLRLLYKTGGTIDEIRQCIGQNIPVIVDWQGSTIVDADGGRGHYSVVSEIDTTGNLMLVDPLPDFSKGRMVSLAQFEEHWWDTDTVVDASGDKTNVRTQRLYFVIVPQSKAEIIARAFNLSPGQTFPYNNHV